MATEAQKKAVSRYDSTNTVQVKLKLNKKSDADILAILKKEDNKQGYIKELIRKDAREKMSENVIAKLIRLQYDGAISAEQGYRLRQLAGEGINIDIGLTGRIDGIDRCLRLADAVREGDTSKIERLVEETRAEADEEERKIKERLNR